MSDGITASAKPCPACGGRRAINDRLFGPRPCRSCTPPAPEVRVEAVLQPEDFELARQVNTLPPARRRLLKLMILD